MFYNKKPKGLNGALQNLGIQFEGREHSGTQKVLDLSKKLNPNLKKEEYWFIPFGFSFCRFGWLPEHGSAGCKDDEGWMCDEDHQESGEGERLLSVDASCFIKRLPLFSFWSRCYFQWWCGYFKGYNVTIFIFLNVEFQCFAWNLFYLNKQICKWTWHGVLHLWN